MAIPYHTHTFEIPAATKEDIEKGAATDKVVVPASLGSAATARADDFATAGQGEKADSALQPGTVTVQDIRTAGTPSDRTVLYGNGWREPPASPLTAVTGRDGVDVSVRGTVAAVSLSQKAKAALARAEAALQHGDVRALAFKDKVTLADIHIRGAASELTVLYGDGVWRVPFSGGGGGGDMSAAVYDPQKKAADVFDMDNMTPGAVNKIMTAPEKAKLAALPVDAVSAKIRIEAGGGLAGGGALGKDITIELSGDTAAAISRGRTALQKSDVGGLAFKNRVAVSDIAATQTPTAATFLRGDGRWAAPSHEGGGQALPAGMVAPFAMKNPPAGWLACDGAHVSRLTYAALFQAIGTLYGNGDNSTTFRLPDLRGEFIRGWDNGRGADADRYFGVWQADAMQRMFGRIGTGEHQNKFDVFTSASGVFSLDGEHIARQGVVQPSDIYHARSNIVFDSKNVARTASETRPRNVALLYCIKY